VYSRNTVEIRFKTLINQKYIYFLVGFVKQDNPYTFDLDENRDPDYKDGKHFVMLLTKILIIYYYTRFI